LNGITSVPNFVKIDQAVQKLLVGDIQTGDLISLLTFLEITLKSEPFIKAVKSRASVREHIWLDSIS
jgi:hypothetical protein